MVYLYSYLTFGIVLVATNLAAAIMTASLLVSSIYSWLASSSSVSSETFKYTLATENIKIFY